MNSITIKLPEENREITVPQGAKLSDALHLETPCGGHGLCGKCRVEIRLPGEEQFRTVSACRYTAEQDLEVRLPKRTEGHQILTDIGTPSQAADDASPGARTGNNTGNRETDGTAEPSVNRSRILAAAFDVGTTTLAGYLLDGETGKLLASAGRLNPQTEYGADVISRTEYANKNGTATLTNCVRAALDELLGELCASAGAERHSVLRCSFVGNTCMHHLLLGLSPESLGKKPYMPLKKERATLPLAELGLHGNPEAVAEVLPVIAGFVGADTVACMLGCRWERKDNITLLVDIGTNCEMVLGNCHRRIVCSTAAGPAFEGTGISCGMRGADGAIDHVRLEDGRIVCHVLGEGEAEGICGSGLTDLLRVLLESGLLEESGRLENKAYNIENSAVTLTQKDVRALQLAKAAVAAGIELMVKRYGIETGEITQVLLAGAFGNFLDPDSAFAIGLLPQELRGKVAGIGNAAGAGAMRCLQERDALRLADSLAAESEFLELASMPEFQDCFVDALAFPEED